MLIPEPTRRNVEVRFAKPHRILSQRSTLLTCVSGTAWITLDGQLADIVLCAGQARRIAENEDALIVGLPHCVVEMT